MSGICITLLAAPLSLAMTAAGGFGGALMAFQVSDAHPGTPASASVGMSEMAGTRSVVATARILALTALCHCLAVDSSVKNKSTWLEMISLSAGPVPLSGTWVSL